MFVGMCVTLNEEVTSKWYKKAATDDVPLAPSTPYVVELVQFDFQQRHPGPAKESPLVYRVNREGSTKCPHRGWLCIAPRVVIHKSYYSAENIVNQLRTSENI